MEARVAALEADMRDVKASQHRTETSLAEIKALLGAVLPTLATKADLATTNGRIDALDAKVVALTGRVEKVETAISDTIKAAIGKAVGPLGFVAMLAGAAGVLGAAAVAVRWLLSHGWL